VDRADLLFPGGIIVRLTEVTLTREGADAESEEFEFVLVSVKDIELIAKVSPDRTGSGQ
jgi:hypothetical protein